MWFPNYWNENCRKRLTIDTTTINQNFSHVPNLGNKYLWSSITKFVGSGIKRYPLSWCMWDRKPAPKPTKTFGARINCVFITYQVVHLKLVIIETHIVPMSHEFTNFNFTIYVRQVINSFYINSCACFRNLPHSQWLTFISVCCWKLMCVSPYWL